MKRFILMLMVALTLAFALVPGTVSAAPAPRKHVVLLDGSGSMEDPTEKIFMYSSGKLQKFVQDLIATEGAFAVNDQIAVGIFSKEDKARGLASPKWIFNGTVGGLRGSFPKLTNLGGWTDLVAALDAGVAEDKAFKGAQYIWLLTDNIDQETDDTKSTERFYQYLASQTDLFRMYVFPVDLKEKNGVVMYAMTRARSADEAERKADGAALDDMVQAINTSPLKPSLGDGGFLVRPLADQGLEVAVTDFIPDKATSPNVTFELDRATNTFALRGFAENKPVKGQFKVVLTSKFPALRIVTAEVEAEMVNISSGDFSVKPILAQKITPTKVSLAPGQKAEYVVDMEIEPPSLTWNPWQAPAGAFTDEGTIRAELRLVVKGVTFAAVQPDRFFKVQRIPEILGNQSRVTVPASAPIVVHVALPWWRAMALIGFFAAIIGLLLLLYWAAFGRKARIRVHNLHMDESGLVTIRKPLTVPGFGVIRARAFGALLFVPDKGIKGEKPQPLHRRSGQITFKDERSFWYELVTQNRQKPQGGKRHERAGSLY